MSIIHGNIRSLRNEVDYITKIIEDYDIVFFTETHLDKLVLDTNIHFFPVTIFQREKIETPMEVVY